MSDSRIVALIDDDLAVLASLKFLLELAGYRVATYSSASAFLDDRGTGATYLIVDQHMPQMTGLELAARVRAEGSAIPLLLVTGSPSPAIVARAAELGIDAVLEKPPNERDLLRFIDAHS
jgi:FixJ family two-component response regulator